MLWRLQPTVILWFNYTNYGRLTCFCNYFPSSVSNCFTSHVSLPTIPYDLSCNVIITIGDIIFNGLSRFRNNRSIRPDGIPDDFFNSNWEIIPAAFLILDYFSKNFSKKLFFP